MSDNFSPRHNPRALFMELLEDRVLFDAVPDLGLDASALLWEEPLDATTLNSAQTVEESSGQFQASSKEIAFVSRDLPNYGLLVADLAVNSSIEVHLLDTDSDGVQQIADVLQSRSDVSAVHVLSHGREGALELGAGQLTADSMMNEHADALQSISLSLTDDADFLIYGCNFGGGAEGLTAAGRLADILGADVAASTNLTGHTQLGGDWDLEVRLGHIETLIAPSVHAQDLWTSVMTAPAKLDWDVETWTSGNTSDTFSVSLTDVTISSNNNATGYPFETSVYSGSGGNGDGNSLFFFNNNNNAQSTTITFDQSTPGVVFTIYDIDNSDDLRVVAFNGLNAVDLTNAYTVVGAGSETFTLVENGLSVEATGVGINSGGNSTNGSLLFELSTEIDRVVIQEINGNGSIGYSVSDIEFSDRISASNNVNTITEEDISISGNVLDNAAGPGPVTVSAVNGSAANVGNSINLNHGAITILSDGTYTYELDNTDSAVQALNYTGNTVMVGTENSDGEGVIVELDLLTGDTIVATTTTLVPYVNGLAANAENNLVYYADDDNIYYWDRAADTHHTLASLTADLGIAAGNGLLSGSATYSDGTLYIGVEPDTGGDMDDVYAITLGPGGTTADSIVNLNVAAAAASAGFANVGGFGDIIISDGVMYGSTTVVGVWSFDLSTSAFTQLNPGYRGQLAATVDGRIFSGAGSTVQQIELATGEEIGPKFNAGVEIFDMSAAIDAPHDPNVVLTETVTYQVSDGNGNTTTVSLTITIDGLNDAPVTGDFSRTFSPNSTNNALSILSPTDVDNVSTELTITIDQIPAGSEGTVRIGSGGAVVTSGATLTVTQLTQLVFTPAADFIGDVTDLEWTVTDPQGATDTGSVAIEIVDQPIRINNVTQDEDQGTITFTVSIAAAATTPLSVEWATASGTATTADYTAASGLLNFLAGEVSQSITISIADDNLFENSESFTVNLSNATNARIADGTGVGTIIDNGTGSDDDRPLLSVNNVSVTEGTDSHAVFNVQLSNPSASAVVVSLAAVDNTATAGADYNSSLEFFDGTNWVAVPANNQLTFAASETSILVRSAITDDVYADDGETFNLIATRVSGTTTNASDSGTATISDDTDTTRVSISGPASVTEGDDATYTVNITNAPLSDVTVNLGYSGTAGGSDYSGVATGTILAGETSATFDLATTDDALVEGAETIVVTIDSLTGDGGLEELVIDSPNDEVTTAIVDNDVPAISINDVTEDEDQGTISFTVSLDQNPVNALSVDWATVTGTATAADFTASNGTLNFAAGESSKTVTIDITDDSIFENSESFTVRLSGPTNATIADDIGVGTIIDNGTGSDDDRPSLSVNNVSVTEGTDSYAVFNVQLSNPSTSAVVVSLATSDNTATAGADYNSSLEFFDGTNWVAVPANNQLTFAASETSILVRSAITDDVYADDGETFNLIATRVSGTTTNASDTGTATISDDTDTTRVSISGPGSVAEGDDVTYTVNITNAPLSDVTVNLGYSGTAGGSDYSGVATGTILAGETSATFDLATTDDALVEGAETIVVTIDSLTGDGGLEELVIDSSNDEVTTTIVDNDIPAISINDVTEDEDQGTISFTVSLDQIPVNALSVDWATVTGTATAADFTASNGTLNFAAGESSKTVTIDITDDSIFENSESFTVRLSGPTNATIADDIGVGTIIDNGTGSDDDRPSLSVNNVSVTEGADSYAVFNVQLSNPSTSAVVVSLATADNTATAGADYNSSLEFFDGTNWVAVPANNQLTFAASETSILVRSAITDDVYADDGETFNLIATRVSGTTTNASDSGTATISDDTDTTRVSISGPASVAEGDDATYTVNITNAPLSDVTVNLGYSGTAGGSDYSGVATGTILAGETSATFDLATTDDALVEGAETIVVTIDSLTGDGGLEELVIDSSNDEVTTTIVDNDIPAISINDVTEDEDQGTMSFTVSLDQNPVNALSVDWATVTGTATAADFTAANGTLNFAVGETSKTVTIDITDDSIFENSESFTVRLSDATNATIADDIGVGRIIDNGTGSDDDRPSLSVNNVSVTEGTDSHAVFNVQLSNPSTSAVVVSLATADNTATAGADYNSSLEFFDGTNWVAVPANNQVTFAASETSILVRSAITDDVYADDGETFNLIATRVSGTTTNASDSGTATISDDTDTTRVSISGPASVAEGDDATYTLNITNAPLSNVTVNLAYSGTAGGSDYSGAATATILAGETSATFDLATTDDALVEGAETIVVTIDSLTGDGGLEELVIDSSSDEVTTTIVDNDVPAISINDVTEDEDQGTISFTVSLDQNPVNALSVDWATVTGTATAADFTAANGTLNFAAGETSKTITIDITDDSIFENSESFTVRLSGPTNSTIADDIGVGTIIDNGTGSDDDRPSLSVNNVSVTEGTDSHAVFNVQLSNPSTSTVVVSLVTSDNTATAGADYNSSLEFFDGTNWVAVPANNQLTFAAGETSILVRSAITDDVYSDDGETFNLIATRVSGTTINSQDTGTATIYDDSDVTRVSLSGPASVAEGATAAFEIEISNEPLTDVVVGLVYSGTATNGDDFTGVASVTIVAGQNSASFDLTTIDDSLVENAESLIVTIGSLSSQGGLEQLVVDLANNSVNTTIVDNDVPAISINDVIEDEDEGTISFTVSLDQNPVNALSVDWATVTGTASSADFMSASGTLNFAANEISKIITIAITDDSVFENQESFAVDLSDASNATIAKARGIGTIVDNGTGSDDDRPQISVSNVTVTEGTDSHAVFDVQLSNPSTSAVVVSVATSAGSATTGADYSASLEYFDGTNWSALPAGDQITFSPLVTSVLVRSAVQDDVYADGGETFHLIATRVSGTTTNANDSGTVTILDDTDTTLATISGPSSVAEGANAAYLLEVGNSPLSDVTFDLTYSGTATNGSDFTGVATATILAGQTTATFDLATTEDSLVEGAETIVVTIDGFDSNGGLEQLQVGPANSVTTTIVDNDVPAISINDVTQHEDQGTISFTVSLDQAASGPLTVDWATVAGTATAADFIAASGTLNFAVNETSKTVAVLIADDEIFEDSESFTVRLSDATNATIQDDTGVGTIIDNGTGSDDDRPALTINDVSVTEGTDSHSVFQVELSNPSTSNVVVSLSTNAGTATADADFSTSLEYFDGSSWVAVPASNQISFAPGEQTVLIRSAITDDVYADDGETFQIVATRFSGITSNSSATGTATIRDDVDVTSISISGSASVSEGATANYTLDISNAPLTDVTVDLAYSGTAAAGTDFNGVASVTILAGQNSATFDLTTINDSLVEGAENVIVAIDGITVDGQLEQLIADPANDRVTTTIVDNDLPAISINDVTQYEDQGTITFTVTLDQAPLNAVTVDWATVAGTATSADFTAATGTLNFAAGEVSKTVAVTIADDSLFENSEQFTVLLSDATNASIANGEGVGTILDNGTGSDDDRPALSVSDVIVIEETDSHSVFRVQLSNPSTTDVVVSVTASSGTATGGSDFDPSLEYFDGTSWIAVPANNQVTISAETTSILVRAAISDDVYADDGETFQLIATRVSGTTTNEVATGTGTINDDTDVTSVSLSGPANVNEGADATYTVNVSNTPLSNVTVNLAYSGTATNGTDYSGTASATILAGKDSVTFNLTTADDALVENLETVVVSITGVVGDGGFEALAVDSTNDRVTTTIVDNDVPAVSINDVVRDEDQGTIAFMVSLDQAAVTPLTVDWATSEWTATAADFTAANGTLNFLAGETSRLITIDITDDVIFENSEAFRVHLTSPTNATIADGIGVGTIVDNGTGSDDDRPEFTITNVAATETDDPYAVFDVRLSNPSTLPIVVELSTADETATGESDYSTSLEYFDGSNWRALPASNQLTFAAEVTSILVRTAIMDDVYADSGETFTLTATRISGQTTNEGDTGRATISDDSDTTLVSIAGPTNVVEGADATYTLNVGNTPLSDIAVQLSYTGTATNGVDFTGVTNSTIREGENSATFDLATLEDSLVEGAESIVIEIVGLTGDGGFEQLQIDGANHQITTMIVDNDVPTISINDVVRDEDQGTISFAVTLDQAPVSPLSVNWATAPGTATSADFTAGSGTLNFSAGETSRTIVISITDDAIFEDSESFFVDLSTPINATIADARGTGTILDNGTDTDDDRPTLSVSNVAVVEGTDSHAVFSVQLSNAAKSPVIVSLATSAGSATAGADYSSALEYFDGSNWIAVPASKEVTFASLQTTILVRAAIQDDVYADDGETFHLIATSVNGIPKNSNASGTATISDDTDATLISIGGPALVSEGNSATYQLNISNTPLTDVVVQLAYSGTATNGVDYTGTTTATILAGENSTTFNLATNDDLLVEQGENIVVAIDGVTGDGGLELVAIDTANGSVSTTIVDNDLPALSINDVTVHEDEGTISFTVSVDQSPVNAMSVDWETAPGTATSADFTAANGTVSFLAGETSKTISVSITDDAVFENSEFFTVELSGAINATIATPTGVGTILDNGTGSDDDRPALLVSNVLVTEGTDAHAVFDVQLSNPSTTPVIVSLITSDGSATTGADYNSSLEYFDGTNWRAVPANNQVEFSPGTTSVLVRSAVADDVYADSGETFHLIATRISGVTTNFADTGTATIVDDTDTTLVALSGPATVNEGSSATYTLNINNTPLSDVTVNFAYSGTASDGSDFTGIDSAIILAGENKVTFNLATLDDALVENAESIVVEIDSLVGSGGLEDLVIDTTKREVTTTIVDNDVPSISINDVTRDEDQGTISFTVTLDQAPVNALTVDWETAEGTANSTDFTGSTGTLNFAAGETSKTITIGITDDSIFENSEFFSVVLSNPVNATISDHTGIGTIVDNGSGTDDDRPALSVTDVTVVEFVDSEAVFEVRLSNASAIDTVVSVTLSDDTATGGQDYVGDIEYFDGENWVSTTGDITFLAGQTSVLVRNPIVDDLIEEDTETVQISAEIKSGVTSNSTALGQISILDNESAPAVNISDAHVIESGTLEFEITLSHPTNAAIVLDLNASPLTATQDTDYESTNFEFSTDGGANWLPGNGSNGTEVTIPALTSSILVRIDSLVDAIDEFDETFQLDATAIVGEVLSVDPGTGTIIDDDAASRIFVNDVTAHESDEIMAFTLTLDRASEKPVVVEFVTANGSAIHGADFESTVGTITFTPLETSRTIWVNLNNDVIDEHDETFLLQLANAQNAVIADAVGLGTILDDDAAPGIQIQDAVRLESSGEITFRVVLDAASEKTVSADFHTTNGDALATADYITKNGTVTFAPGNVEQFVTVQLVDDLVDEPTETFNVSLSNLIHATSTDHVAVGRILDDDHTPELTSPIPDQVSLDGDTIALPLNSFFSDADDDELSFAIDGLPAGLVVGPTTGVITGEIQSDGSQQGPDSNGVYEVSVVVSDGNNSVETTFRWTVSNPAPTATDDHFTTAEDTPLIVDPANSILHNDSDPDGDVIFVETTAVTQPDHGTLTLANDGTFEYRPDVNFAGTDQFTYRITDREGGSAEAVVFITVTPVNDKPIATDDSAVTREEVPVDISVLSNDTDVEGPVTIQSTTSPTNGTVTVRDDGTIRYTPDTNYFGNDSFEYVIVDRDGDTDTARVVILVTNEDDPPQANPDFATTTENTPVHINSLSNDVHPDFEDMHIQSVTDPSNGSVILRPDGTFEYTPDDRFHGNDSFYYTIEDESGETSTALVSVVVSNFVNPPIAVADSATTQENVPVVIEVLNNDSDPDDDAVTITGTSTPSNGTLTVQDDGTILYTPRDGFTGNDSFLYTISDGDEGFATTTVDVLVTPEPDATVGIAKEMSIAGKTVTIRLTIQNFGNEPTVKLSLTDDLVEAFGEDNFVVTKLAVVTMPTDPASTIAVNHAFDGSSDTELLHEFSVLSVGDGAVIEVALELSAADSTEDEQTDIVFENNAQVVAEDSTGRVYLDDSVDGDDPDPDQDNDPTNNSGPSVVRYTVRDDFFSFDSHNDLSEHNEDRSLWTEGADEFRREVILSKQIPLLAPEPIFSGSARPGTQIIGRIIDGNGRVVAESMSFADPGGNWMMQFHNTSTNQNYRIEFSEVVGMGDPLQAYGDIYGYRGFERENNDYAALQPWTRFGEPYSVGKVLRESAPEAIERMHRQNADPLGLNS